MGRRFEELEDVYNTLTAANFSFESLPANNKYRKYAEWKQDPEKREIGEAAVPDSGRKLLMGLESFGLDPTPANNEKIVVKLGTRSFTYWNGLSGTQKPLFGLTDGNPASNLDNFRKLPGFQPAKAVIGVKGTGTTQISEITGQRYKRSVTTTYTIPFGRNGTNDFEIETQDAIVNEFAETHSVTFKAEKLRRGF